MFNMISHKTDQPSLISQINFNLYNLPSTNRSPANSNKHKRIFQHEKLGKRAIRCVIIANVATLHVYALPPHSRGIQN